MNRYKFDEQLHRHTLDGKDLTGCSTVVGVLSKPLSWWASGKAVERLGWIHGNPKVNGKYKKTPTAERYAAAMDTFKAIQEGTIDKYVSLLDKAYKAHSVKLKDSAQSGIDLHAELEAFVKDQMAGQTGIYIDKIKPFIEWSKTNVHHFTGSEAYCYSEPMWTGGICDAIAQLNDTTYAVIDFKSSKEAYTSHFIQASGYAAMIEENGIFDKDGNPVKMTTDAKYKGIDKVIIFAFGGETLIPATKDAGTFKEGFKNCTAIYRLLKSQEE